MFRESAGHNPGAFQKPTPSRTEKGKTWREKKVKLATRNR